VAEPGDLFEFGLSRQGRQARQERKGRTESLFFLGVLCVLCALGVSSQMQRRRGWRL